MSETPGIKTSPYSRSRKNEKKKKGDLSSNSLAIYRHVDFY